MMKDLDMYIPTYDDVIAAHDRIRPYIHRTPVLTSSYLDDLIGAQLFFKCENFQKAGAFKVRGASNAVFGLSDAAAARGVCTHSSGNHALSLSYAAGRRGIPCHVVMPRTAPDAKKAAVRGYGGIITECEPSTTSREEVFAQVQARTGGDFVHPYNDPRVIAGQGTGRLEFMEQTDRKDMMVSPIVGGAAINGPTAKMMRELAIPATAAQVAAHYGDLLNGFVLDAADRDLDGTLGTATIVAQTVMLTLADRIALAERVLEFVEALR
jgi:threonine dehydratase